MAGKLKRMGESRWQTSRLLVWPLSAIAFASGVRVLAAARVDPRATSADNRRVDEFVRLAAQVTQTRQQGGEENEKLQEQAFGLLDATVLEALNAQEGPKVAALNEQLARFVSHRPPAGEDYHIAALSEAPPVFALVANLGLGGPSAVRLYSKLAGARQYLRVARLDRYTQKDFFDEYLVLIPIAPSGVFVTVSGRTDDLQTGSFNAWHFDGQRFRLLWASDLLPMSSYENRSDGFWISYCGEPNEEKPRDCRGMFQDRYTWDGSAWKLAEHKTAPPARS